MSLKTLTEKVEQLIDKAELCRFYVNEFRHIRIKTDTTVAETPLLDCSSLNSAHESFRACANLKIVRLTNTHNISNWGSCFNGSSELETIETLDFSSTTNASSCFNGCVALVNLMFVKETIKIAITIPSPILSDESIQSIIDGLATVETQQALTLNSAVVDRLTDEQTAQIFTKKWTVN